MTLFLKRSTSMLLACFIFSVIFSIADMKMTRTNLFSSIMGDKPQDEANSFCISYLAFNIWENPVEESNKWYGLKGKSLTGKTF